MEHEQKIKSIKAIFPEDLENSETINELSKTKQIEEEIDRNDLIFEVGKYVYNFRKFQTIRSFGDNGKITISEANQKQSNFWNVTFDLIMRSDQDQKQMKRKQAILMKF